MREIDLNRKWPIVEDDRVFSPPKGRVNSKKHLMTPSPKDDRNVRQKTDTKSSDDESNEDEQLDDELCAKFLKIKGKNKKVSINIEKEDYLKLKGKKHKSKK